jgi:hypothetical protein
MDVVQKVLQDDPFFRERMGGPAQWGRKNRRGVSKRYSELTVAVVLELAKAGLDAVNMRRDQLVAAAFEYCRGGENQSVMAA